MHRLSAVLTSMLPTISTLSELEHVRTQCKKMVSKQALLSAAAAVIPIPGVDVSTDVAILLQLIPKINDRFGLSPQQIDQLSPDLQKMIVVGGTSVSVGLLGKVITPQRIIQLLQRIGLTKLTGKYAAKYIPIVGMVVASSISYVVLRKVGQQHIDECYNMAKKLIEASVKQNNNAVRPSP